MILPTQYFFFSILNNIHIHSHRAQHAFVNVVVFGIAYTKIKLGKQQYIYGSGHIYCVCIIIWRSIYDICQPFVTDVDEKKYDGNPYILHIHSDNLRLYSTSTITNHCICAHIMKRDKQLEFIVQFYNGMLNVTDGTRLHEILKAWGGFVLMELNIIIIIFFKHIKHFSAIRHPIIE